MDTAACTRLLIDAKSELGKAEEELPKARETRGGLTYAEGRLEAAEQERRVCLNKLSKVQEESLRLSSRRITCPCRSACAVLSAAPHMVGC